MSKKFTSKELNNEEVLNKADNLLLKHQKQAKKQKNLINANSSGVDYTSVSSSSQPQNTQSSSNEIPTLIEMVILQPVAKQAQEKKTTSFQQILDSSLKEAGINLKTTEKISLTQAIQRRLYNKIQ